MPKPHTTKNRAVLTTEKPAPETPAPAAPAAPVCPACAATEIETHHASNKSRCTTCGHWFE
jgi:hypothetical protein